MDMLIDPITNDYTGARTETLANAVYMRLMVPLGSYWADISLGSRLHELAREKDVPRVYRLAKQYTEQALQPLLDDGRASVITVDVNSHTLGLLLHIQVTDKTGHKQLFNHHVKVS